MWLIAMGNELLNLEVVESIALYHDDTSGVWEISATTNAEDEQAIGQWTLATFEEEARAVQRFEDLTRWLATHDPRGSGVFNVSARGPVVKNHAG